MAKDGITPKEFRPKCILPNFRSGKIILSLRMVLRGIMLNSVGLVDRELKLLFEDGRWQERTDLFCISFMSVADTPEKRILEAEMFVKLFAKYLPGFRGSSGYTNE